MRDRRLQRIRPAWQAMLDDVRDLAGAAVRMGDTDAVRRIPGHAAAMLSDARDLAGALTVAGDRAARRIPGYSEAVDQLRRAELALLRELREHLDEVDGPADESVGGDPRPQLLRRLLTASLAADSELSRENLHLRILRSLVPDEARILAALADGTRFPLVHVENPGTGRIVLANASTVGRAAGVHLQATVPVYVSHLRALGLVGEGPKDDALADGYALLNSEGYVRRALEESSGGLRGNRAVQRTLRLSPLGAELWAACRPDEPSPPPPHTVNGAVEPYRSAYAGVRDPEEDAR